VVLKRGCISVTVTDRKRRVVSYLDPEEVVPPFNEVAGEVPSGLPDNLHPNVVPGHSRHPTPIVHIFLGFVQGVEVRHPSVAVILACKM
jgi:hypothetical protein